MVGQLPTSQLGRTLQTSRLGRRVTDLAIGRTVLPTIQFGRTSRRPADCTGPSRRPAGRPNSGSPPTGRPERHPLRRPPAAVYDGSTVVGDNFNNCLQFINNSPPAPHRPLCRPRSVSGVFPSSGSSHALATASRPPSGQHPGPPRPPDGAAVRSRPVLYPPGDVAPRTAAIVFASRRHRFRYYLLLHGSSPSHGHSPPARPPVVRSSTRMAARSSALTSFRPQSATCRTAAVERNFPSSAI